MRIRLLFLGCLVALTSFSQKNIFPHSGTLIIIGGGSMPDTMYQTFAKLIGGKNQPVVYIPTATGDEEWIQQGKHLDKFIQQGFTQLKTLHTRDRKKAEGPELAAMIDRAKGVFLGGGEVHLGIEQEASVDQGVQVQAVGVVNRMLANDFAAVHGEQGFDQGQYARHHGRHG